MKTKFLIGLVMVMIFDGCKKDGPTGPAGKDGKDGNANVTSTTTTPTWYWDATSHTLKADINPLMTLTTAVSENGVVLVYFKTSTGDWVPLPRTVYPTTSISQSQRFSYTPFWLVLILQN